MFIMPVYTEQHNFWKNHTDEKSLVTALMHHIDEKARNSRQRRLEMSNSSSNHSLTSPATNAISLQPSANTGATSARSARIGQQQSSSRSPRSSSTGTSRDGPYGTNDGTSHRLPNLFGKKVRDGCMYIYTSVVI